MSDTQAEKLLGGSINTKKVQFRDVEPRAPVQGKSQKEGFHEVLQRVAKEDFEGRMHDDRIR